MQTGFGQVGSAREVATQMLAVFVFEQEEADFSSLGLDQHTSGLLTALAARGEISGRAGDSAVVHRAPGDGPTHVAVIGLGRRAAVIGDSLRVAASDAYRRARGSKCSSLAFVLPCGDGLPPLEDQLAAVIEGAILTDYSFARHKQAPTTPPFVLESLQVVRVDEQGGAPGEAPAFAPAAADVERMLEVARVVAEATNFARDVINEPANVMTPVRFADTCREMAGEHGLDLQVLEQDEVAAKGMGLLMSVAAGSAHPPCMVTIHYRGAGEQQPAIGVLGKGVTFDSGGISLKPSAGMFKMKRDMAGAATVLAVMRVLAQLRPRVNVTGVMVVAENMPAGDAFRPGDILTAYSGQTVEIFSTDAEGRLMLGDALTYMQRDLGLREIVDLATLTGAVERALGARINGYLGNDPELRRQLEAVQGITGEDLWELPLATARRHYGERIKSHFADLKNLSYKPPQVTTAALFLEAFIEEGTRWGHLDIAGTAMMDGEWAYLSRGATGSSVRLIARWLLNRSGGEGID